MVTKATKDAKLPAPDVPELTGTIAEVFIIESLKPEDEKAARFDGRHLEDMLRLAGKNPKYFYFQSKSELPHIIALFRQSRYRYLHLSCHASGTHIATTRDLLPYADFAKYLDGHLPLRRLFCSACELGNQNFAKCVTGGGNKGMHSFIAPVSHIQFDHSAAAWSAFYLSMFTENDSAMKKTHIRARLQALTLLFPIEFYFAAYGAHADKWSDEVVKPPTLRS